MNGGYFMSKDDYFDLLEEQHQFDVILHTSQIDAEVPDNDHIEHTCNGDCCTF